MSAAGQKPKYKKRLIALVAGLAALLVLIPALLFLDPGGERRFRQTYQEAAAAYQAGDYDNALSLLRRAEGIRHSDESMMLMVDCYEAQGNLDMALEILRQMDTGESRVSSRIASLERRRMQDREVETVTIGDRELRLDLTELDLSGAGLGDAVLPQLRSFRALETLNLSRNGIDDLTELKSFGGLTSLDLSGNPVSDLSPLAALSGLRYLVLDDTGAADFTPLYKLSNLSSLSLLGLELTPEQLSELTAALPNCAVHTDSDREGILTVTLHGVSFASDVKVLDLSGMGLRDLSALRVCTQLTTLRLGDNAIGDLQPLMNLSQLQALELQNNQISDLRPLIGLSSLSSLNVAGNQITETSAAGSIASLRVLDLSDNPIRDFSGLGRLTDLGTLHLENCGLASENLVELYPMAHLRLLYLDGNEGLADSAIGGLQRALPGCAISHSDLIYTVELAGSLFLSDLTELDLSGRGIDDLSGIESFGSLEKADLSHNDIRVLLNLQISKSRDSLRELDLSFNQLSDVSALAELKALEVLDLSGNHIELLQPLNQLTGLKKLYLTGNPLSEDQLEALRAALPDCEIVY